MENTALQQRRASLQAQTGDYIGVATTLDFGDPAHELVTLLERCAVFDLNWRAKISVTGKDRARWLHNMVTNNIRDLELNHGDYNFVLNAQGRILGDLYAYNQGESLLLDTDRRQVEPLLNAMKRFIIMDKVEMNDAPERVALGICGPLAEAMLASAGIDAGRLGALEVREQTLGERQALIVRGPQNKPGWYEVWSDRVGVEDVRESLLRAGAEPAGTHALEWWRILRGIPNYGQDIRERDLPQETGQVQALSFDKGCYIGQEIVERIRSRGQVHRKFTGFEFEDPAPTLGKYEAEGRTIAEVTSIDTITTSAGERTLGLGYVRQEAIASGSQLDLGGRKASIVEVPFAI